MKERFVPMRALRERCAGTCMRLYVAGCNVLHAVLSVLHVASLQRAAGTGMLHVLRCMLHAATCCMPHAVFVLHLHAACCVRAT
jgi:hypothetical protein